MSAVTFVTRAVLGLRGEANQASRLFKDDSFYMMSCAWHLAQGHGLTADGVHPTNGIQPLFVFLDVPMFWLAQGDRWLGVQLTYIPMAIFSAISVLLAALIMRTLYTSQPDDDRRSIFRDPVILVAILWTASYPMLAQMMNGLETGLSSMMFLVSVYAYCRIETSGKRSIKQYALFGGVLGVLVLARIDAVFFVAAICISELIRFRSKALLRILVMGAVAVLVSSPWFIYNYMLFGNLMPMSGRSESAGPVPLAINIHSLGFFLADIVTVFIMFPLSPLSIWVWPTWTAAILIPAILLWRRFEITTLVQRNLNVRPLIPWMIAAGALGLYYVFIFHAPYFLDRYLQPLRILWFFVIAIIIARIQVPHWGPIWKVSVASFVALGLLFGCARYVNNFTATWVSDLYEAGLWAKSHPQSRVGMCQSGVAGFTADNVWNLDGKVNHDALLALKNHTMHAYLDTTRFDYLADWLDFMHNFLEVSQSANRYRQIDSFKLVRIYQRVE